MAEVLVLREFDSVVNIVQYVDAFIQDNVLKIVMEVRSARRLAGREPRRTRSPTQPLVPPPPLPRPVCAQYCEGGDLASRIKQCVKEGTGFSEEVRRFLPSVACLLT